MSNDNAKNTPFFLKGIEVQWIVPPGPELFINQMMVQFDGTLFHLMFASVNPPPFVAKTEAELKEHADQIKSLPAIPVGRFVVPLENLKEMVTVLKQQIDYIDSCKKNDQ
jgi:hypothetical protein